MTTPADSRPTLAREVARLVRRGSNNLDVATAAAGARLASVTRNWSGNWSDRRCMTLSGTFRGGEFCVWLLFCAFSFT